MVFERVEKLKRDYTDKFVVVDPERPELGRFAHLVGQVKTVNMSGRALVEFNGDDIGWYDIDLDFLKVVEGPDAEPPRPRKAPVAKEKPAAKASAKKPAAAASGKKMSTSDVLAAARGGKAASSGDKKRPSTADILAAARGKAKPTQQAEGEPEAEAAAPPSKPAGKMSTADILAAARGKAKPAEPAGAAEGSARAAVEAEPDSGGDEAVAEPQTEASAATETSESPAESSPAPSVDPSSLPTTMEEKIAYCRKVDAG